MPLAGNGGKMSKPLSVVIDDFAANSTLHSFAFAKYCSESPTLRKVIMAVGVCNVVALCAYIAVEAVAFFGDPSHLSSTTWVREGPIPFPRVAACSPHVFSKRKMDAYNVSDLLASYMTYAVGPNSISVLRSWYQHPPRGKEPDFIESRLEAAEEELQRALAKHDMTFVQLFRALAVTCEEVVVNCQLMGSEVGEGGSCCEQYFDREPFFDANSGTCYEGDFMLTPVEAMRMQRLRFWLRIDRNDLFDMDMFLLGDEVVPRFSPVFALSHGNNLQKSDVFFFPHKSIINQVKSLSLTIYKVDREKLGMYQEDAVSDPPSGPLGCAKKDLEGFASVYGIPYTQNNCILLRQSYLFPNCTMADLLRLPTGVRSSSSASSSIPRTCLPSDMVHMSRLSEGEFDPLRWFPETVSAMGGSVVLLRCPRECAEERVEVARATDGEGNFAPLRKILNETGRSLRGAEVTGIEMFYESFEYPAVSLYKEGVEVLMSRIGGWLGIYMGASLISLLEMIVFIAMVAQRHLKNLAVNVSRQR